jgi:hypothetical protein
MVIALDLGPSRHRRADFLHRLTRLHKAGTARFVALFKKGSRQFGFVYDALLAYICRLRGPCAVLDPATAIACLKTEGLESLEPKLSGPLKSKGQLRKLTLRACLSCQQCTAQSG